MVIALLLAGLVSGAAPASSKPKLIVLEMAAAGGVDPSIASALTEAASTEISKSGYFEVVAKKDIDTMLGMERQRQLMGCSDNTSCFAELAGALGARFVMTGTIAKLGDAYQLGLQVMDTVKAQPVGRTTRMARELTVLRRQIAYAVAEASGIPPPPPPSHVVPYSMMGAGALALLGGGLAGMDAFSRERSIRDQLALGEQSPGTLQTYSTYQKAAAEIGGEKTLALVLISTAAVLIGGGAYLNPWNDAQGAVAVMLVPGGGGVAFSGTFR